MLLALQLRWMILLDVRREHSIEDCSTPNEKLNAPVEIPPFENRKGWGSLTKINFQKVGQPPHLAHFLLGTLNWFDMLDILELD